MNLPPKPTGIAERFPARGIDASQFPERFAVSGPKAFLFAAASSFRLFPMATGIPDCRCTYLQRGQKSGRIGRCSVQSASDQLAAGDRRR